MFDQWLLASRSTFPDFCPHSQYKRKVISKQNLFLSPENQNIDFQKKIFVSVVYFYTGNQSQNTHFLLWHLYNMSHIIKNNLECSHTLF